MYLINIIQSIHAIRKSINNCKTNLTHIKEISKRIVSSLNNINIRENDIVYFFIIQCISEFEERVKRRVDFYGMKEASLERIEDLSNKVGLFENEINELQLMADVISENQNFKLQEIIGSNTKNLEDMFRNNERTCICNIFSIFT